MLRTCEPDPAKLITLKPHILHVVTIRVCGGPRAGHRVVALEGLGPRASVAVVPLVDPDALDRRAELTRGPGRALTARAPHELTAQFVRGAVVLFFVALQAPRASDGRTGLRVREVVLGATCIAVGRASSRGPVRGRAPQAHARAVGRGVVSDLTNRGEGLVTDTSL